jgi:hypothetical protein
MSRQPASFLRHRGQPALSADVPHDITEDTASSFHFTFSRHFRLIAFSQSSASKQVRKV